MNGYAEKGKLKALSAIKSNRGEENHMNWEG